MRSLYIVILFLSVSLVQAQGKFLTKQGEVSFFSSTAVEDIKADNNQVLSIVDAKDGAIAIAILMKSFMFEKSLMQEHFNENYVESDDYPKANFKGKISDFDTLKVGGNDVIIKGKITIHGVTKPIEILAKLSKSEDNIKIIGKFDLAVADFNIKIPTLVAKNIAKKMVVSFNFDHSKYSR